MPGAHRDTDARYCGGQTKVVGQSTVFVNSLLTAVDGDPQQPGSHGSTSLVPVIKKTIFAEGKNVICAPGDKATGVDGKRHIPPQIFPREASNDTFYYSGTGGGS
jgi:hypothetical protein